MIDTTLRPTKRVTYKKENRTTEQNKTEKKTASRVSACRSRSKLNTHLFGSTRGFGNGLGHLILIVDTKVRARHVRQEDRERVTIRRLTGQRRQQVDGETLLQLLGQDGVIHGPPGVYSLLHGRESAYDTDPLWRGRVPGNYVAGRAFLKRDYSMSSAAGRKRAAPKVDSPPAPAPAPAPAPVVIVPDDPLLRAAQAAGVLLISQAQQESMAQREEARPIDPPLNLGQRGDDGRGRTHAYATAAGILRHARVGVDRGARGVGARGGGRRAGYVDGRLGACGGAQDGAA